ncbi:MAG: tRNA uridine-5-carboxymethylaminomethyl(34) synthesis GTPase MnmE [Peptococcales bacterium]
MINDTIAAIITPIGAASIGVIRISGIEAFNIGSLLYKGRQEFLKAPSHSVLYGKVFDPINNMVIDEALFLKMKRPRTFTGEDIVEIQCHGGMVSVRKVLEVVLRNGARLAEPGEFSKRAFLNGKLDLAQAESIMDIVNAKTEKGLEVAVSQLQGDLSQLISEIRKDLLRLVAFIEADIDFPDDDIERLSTADQVSQIEVLAKKISKILDTSQKGKIIREGLNVAIVGKPNVGKSSLLNALLKENKAIVTDIPGTTRDVIEEYINLNGIPIKLIDTAGIRATDNLVEQIGVKRAREFLKNADLVLYVLDIVTGLSSDDLEIINDFIDKIPAIFIANKVDLDFKEDNLVKIENLVGKEKIIFVSAKEKTGLDELEEKITDMFFKGNMKVSDETIITNARHVQALQLALDHLGSALESLKNEMPGDFVVIDIRSSWEFLGKITGDTVEDDILNKIFSQFCLGK